MRLEIVTLFPELFDVLNAGLLGKAREAGRIDVHTITPRRFTTDRHRTVDDSPYGGGSGMVLMPGPYAVNAAPARQTAAVETVMRLAPKRSTSTPPTRISTMFGRLYIALRRPICVSVNPRCRCSRSATGPMQSYT